MGLIPLTQGQHAIVDDEDLERVSRYRWHLTKGGYAATHGAPPDRRRMYLHRFIMDTPSGMVTDHVDGSRKLDCRKSNLRIGTQQHNVWNTGKRGKNADEPVGVRWDDRRRCWHAAICHSGRRIHLGYFKDRLEATVVYNDAAGRLRGALAWLNPIEPEECSPQEQDRILLQHARTSHLVSRNTSGYRGVSWDKTNDRWEAYISHDGRRYHIGRYASLKEAARAYNARALALHGARAHLNPV